MSGQFSSLALVVVGGVLRCISKFVYMLPGHIANVLPVLRLWLNIAYLNDARWEKPWVDPAEQIASALCTRVFKARLLCKHSKPHRWETISPLSLIIPSFILRVGSGIKALGIPYLLRIGNVLLSLVCRSMCL